MASLKKQLLMVAVGCLLMTALFGGLLSLAVNQSLEQLKEQPDLIVPGTNNPSSFP